MVNVMIIAQLTVDCHPEIDSTSFAICPICKSIDSDHICLTTAKDSVFVDPRAFTKLAIFTRVWFFPGKRSIIQATAKSVYNMRSIADDVIVETFRTTSLVVMQNQKIIAMNGWVIGDNLVHSRTLFTQRANDNNEGARSRYVEKVKAVKDNEGGGKAVGEQTPNNLCL